MMLMFAGRPFKLLQKLVDVRADPCIRGKRDDAEQTMQLSISVQGSTENGYRQQLERLKKQSTITAKKTRTTAAATSLSNKSKLIVE